jgi:hypothetical protein
MTIIEPRNALCTSLFEDLERMSLSLNRAFPSFDSGGFDHLLETIDTAEKDTSPRSAHLEG